MSRIWFALSMGTAGLVLLGASSIAGATESSTSVDLKQQQAIQHELQKAPDLGDSRIQVKVDDGIAVLEGTVDSKQEKKEAQQLAHVEGILGVNNRLQVQEAGKQPSAR